MKLVEVRLNYNLFYLILIGFAFANILLTLNKLSKNKFAQSILIPLIGFVVNALVRLRLLVKRFVIYLVKIFRKLKSFVLAYGLEFCLLPTNIKREEVFAEFEILFAQLLYHKPKSIDELSLLKAKLNKLAHSFCGSLIDVTKFLFILTVFKRLSLYVLINTF